MVEDAIAKPETLKYYLTQPLQITSRFYPLLFLTLLLLSQLRVDPLVPSLLAVLLHFAKFNPCITLLTTRIEERLYGDTMNSLGLIRT